MTAGSHRPAKARSQLAFAFLAMLMFVLLAPLAQAGTPTNPEIRDSPTDSARTLGAVSQPYEITKGWIGTEGDDLLFTIELSGAPEVPPPEAVYTFHFTWDAYRFYWMMNTTEEGPTFSGGAYQGTPASDRFGSTRYLYLEGQAGDNLTGEFRGGPGARVIWRYDVNNFGTPGEEPILFSGMAIHAYMVENGGLTLIDGATGDDYIHIVLLPWHERLWNKIPGPSPVLVMLAAGALVAIAARQRKD